MTLSQRFDLALADLVLVIHVAFVGFVVAGLALIWIGYFRGWRFVRNPWFRATHLAAIGFVAVESLSGVICPLTIWENRLRVLAGGERRYAGSFLEHWLHRILFFDCDSRIFTAAYVAFFLVVALSLWMVPPRWRRTRTVAKAAQDGR